MFYIGKKPGLFAHERAVDSIDHAQQLSRTRYCWIVNYLSDYTGWDWLWEPSPWQANQIHVWPSQWHQYSGTYLVTKHSSKDLNFHNEVIQNRQCRDNWTAPANIDENSIDWTWAPHPLDPPYIYHFPSQHQSASGVTYTVPGATNIKLVNDFQVIALSAVDNWTIVDTVSIHKDRFDWSWTPNTLDPPYTYVWGNQWWPGEKMPTVKYCVPGAHDIKYMDTSATLRSSVDGWTTLHPVDKFDYSWCPDPQDPPYIYVFGNQHYPGTIMPTVVYTVPGATQKKFVDVIVAQLSESRTNWQVMEPIAEDEWDWTWQPNPLDPPYIYVFGNQWNPAEYKASVKYVVPEAKEVKYLDRCTRRLPQPELFNHNLAVSKFDYSWEPNPFDPPFTYVFGNQWNPAVLEPTVIYSVPGATEIKYIDDVVATVAQDYSVFEILDDVESFDYSWRPNPTDPPYIYVFGNQWLTPEQRPALRYVVPGAVDIKYMNEPRACRVGNPEKFKTLHDCDFDYSWEPDPGSPPYNYVFGNQWWPAEIMPTVMYSMPGAVDVKYMSEPCALLHERHDNHWETVIDCEWDYSWRPDPGDPPYNYVFGNQWYPAEVMPTVKYHMPEATQEKFLEYPQARLLSNTDRWTVPEEVDSTNIDFSWVPHPNDAPYVHHFGSEYQMSIGLTYTTPGATEPKFEREIPRLVKEKKAVDVVDIFFIDRSNATSASRFQSLQSRYPHIQRVRYVNSIMDTIKRCVPKAKTSRFWVIGSENVYDDFDFAWHAQPWQSFMTHVFGSQWNKWSDTFLINKWEFDRHAKWANGIEQFPNLNFVQDQIVTAPADACDIYVIDHGNEENSRVLEFLNSQYRVVKRARYFDNYLDTLRRLLQDVEADHVWVVSSICDYSRFDFSWQPEAWQREMLHVFPSNEQKFGDTFYVPVQALREQIEKLELLDWFNTVNYCNDQSVPRWTIPIFTHSEDSHVDYVHQVEFLAPLALFTNRKIDQQDIPAVSLWREQTKTIVPLDIGAAAVVVPRTAIGSMQKQFYDYPYIDKTQRKLTDQALDIVFISNGEPNADANWQHLQSIAQSQPNRCTRVDGVNGRSAAYKAAAESSSTPWFFSVFAKLEIDPDFSWSWQPDRMQRAKHYIFNSHNPVNGLEYGHQGLIAYNKKLVMSTEEIQGLDFTLSQPHGVEPVLSGTAHFNTDPWSTWRTAFREVAKLQYYAHVSPDVETDYRLGIWQTRAEGNYAEWSLRGARDAVEYYQSVDGQYDQLLLTFEWAWLRQYFDNKYQA